MGSSYFLSPDEELWNKVLPENIEAKYLSDMNLVKRDKSRLVKYNCPFNSIMQIYNLKTKKNRIIFGPDLAVLDPEEEFTLIELSGKTPKKGGFISTLYLKLGPIFSSDQFTVETIDHTKLKLIVSYDWIFDIKHGDEENASKIFTIRDFVGNMVKTMASKIRSTIATISFEEFHKNSDLYIRKSVFGENADGKMNHNYRFEECNLLINNVDIRGVEPIDEITKMLLQKSVSLAIELTTKTYEQEFQIQQLIKDQEFKGEVEKLKIQNEINLIKKEIDLNKLKVESGIITENGLSRANALAHKDSVSIESKSKVDLAQMKIDAD
jgi:major vault protein